MESKNHVLVVDDDRDIRVLLGDFLKLNGFRISLASNGRQMREVLAGDDTDLVVLDLMLPGEDGLRLCRDLRTRSDVPVLMLTARAEPIDRVLGLEMGADDYLAKPFEPRELLARIRNILRRVQSSGVMGLSVVSKEWRFSGWVLNRGTRELVSPLGVLVLLSGAEYRLLEVFLNHPNRVLSRDHLMDLIRGTEAGPFDRSIDLRVSRLRQKLGDNARAPQLIKTLRNEGYLLATTVQCLDASCG